MFNPGWLRNPLRLLALLIIFFLTSCSASRKTTETAVTNISLQKKYAALLQVPSSHITNNDLYAFIDKWLNTRYKYGSQGLNGIDCSGFTQLLYDAVYRKKLPRTSQAQYDQAKHVNSKKRLAEGDLVFFATNSGKKITHVGVYLQNDRFVNATSKGVVISDMNLKYWSERFLGGGKP